MLNQKRNQKKLMVKRREKMMDIISREMMFLCLKNKVLMMMALLDMGMMLQISQEKVEIVGKETGRMMITKEKTPKMKSTTIDQ